MLLISEVTRNFDLLDRMLANHFRVLQEMGIEPKLRPMAPNATTESDAMAEVGKISPLIARLVQMPKPEFLELVRRRCPERFAKAPLAEGEVIEAQATERGKDDAPSESTR